MIARQWKIEKYVNVFLATNKKGHPKPDLWVRIASYDMFPSNDVSYPRQML